MNDLGLWDAGTVSQTRDDIALATKAIDREWHVSPELRALAIEQARLLLASQDAAVRPATKLGALKALILADGVNVRREAIATQTSEGARDRGASLLRTALTSTSGRAALAALSAQSCQSDSTALAPAEQPVEPALAPVQGDAPEDLDALLSYSAKS